MHLDKSGKVDKNILSILDVAPTWTPSSVTVIPDVDFDTDPFYPTYYFTCSFTPETTEALLYKITWFINSAKIKETGYLTESDMANSGRLTQIDLTSRGYKLNIMVRKTLHKNHLLIFLPSL